MNEQASTSSKEPRIAWIGSFGAAARTDEERLADALERQGAHVLRITDPWSEPEKHVRSADLDWIIFSKCAGLSGEAGLSLISSARPRTAQVLFDLMDFEERQRSWPSRKSNRLQWWVPMARRFDLVFCKELGNIDRYRSLGIAAHFLDQAVDPSETPVDGRGPSADVAFFGRWTSERERFLTNIARRLKVLVYTENRRPWMRGWGLSIRPAVHGDDLGRAINGATVVWGENARHDIEGYWSNRPYLVAGRGGCLVTRYTPGLEGVFRNGHSLVWYHSEAEAIELIERLVGRPDVAKRIGRAAAVHVHQSHSYDHRALELLQQLRRKKPIN